jgi:hypothetical protein
MDLSKQLETMIRTVKALTLEQKLRDKNLLVLENSTTSTQR